MENFKLKSKKVKEIESYCNLIYERNRKLNIKDHILDSNRTGKEINLQGLGAEIWYKEKYNIPYTLSEDEENFKPRTYKNDIDCIRNGYKLELKQTSYPSGCFFIASSDHYRKPRNLLSDVYVLIVGSFPDYERDLYIGLLSLTKKYYNFKTSNLVPTIHPKIGKLGYHMEQDEMYSTLEEALENDGRTSQAKTSTM